MNQVTWLGGNTKETISLCINGVGRDTEYWEFDSVATAPQFVLLGGLRLRLLQVTDGCRQAGSGVEKVSFALSSHSLLMSP